MAERRRSSSASSSSVAVAAALDACPVPRRSRGGRGPGLRSDSPGSVRITFRSSTSSPSKLAVERLLGDLAALDRREALGDEVGGGRVALRSRRALGRELGDRARGACRGGRASKIARRASAAQGSGCGSTENISTTNATTAGRRPSAIDAGVDHRQKTAPSFAGGLLTVSTPSVMAEASARILLVDDEQAMQTLLTYPLRKEGYEVVAALDGREALERFAEQRFDLVVLDMMLPKLDGIEVCRRLRSRSQVPIIMLTAKDDEIDKVARARDGRRRLHHQAVLGARVPQPRQGRAAALGDGARRSAAGEPIGAGELRDRLRAPLGDDARRAGRS